MCTYDVALYGLGHNSGLLKRGCLCGLFLGHFGALGHGFFNTADHIERLLGQVIVLAVNNTLEGADSVFQGDVLTSRTGKRFSNEKWL